MLSTLLACSYVAAMALFSLAALIDWFRSRKQLRPYVRYGIAAGVLIVALDVIIIVATPSMWSAQALISLVTDVVVFVRTVGFTMLGMSYCVTLGLPSLPFLQNPHPDVSAPILDSESLPVEETAVQDKPVERGEDLAVPLAATATAVSEPSAQVEATPVPEPVVRVNGRHALIATLAVTTVGVLYSVMLFSLTHPTLSDLLKRSLGGSPSIDVVTVTTQSLVIALAFAVGEEITFRLGLQNYLAKHLRLTGPRYWIAIVTTTLVWTLGHAGTLQPEWVKLAQVFPFGLMLGWLFKKYGLEASLSAHALFNVIMVFTGSALLG